MRTVDDLLLKLVDDLRRAGANAGLVHSYDGSGETTVFVNSNGVDFSTLRCLEATVAYEDAPDLPRVETRAGDDGKLTVVVRDVNAGREVLEEILWRFESAGFVRKHLSAAGAKELLEPFHAALRPVPQTCPKRSPRCWTVEVDPLADPVLAAEVKSAGRRFARREEAVCEIRRLAALRRLEAELPPFQPWRFDTPWEGWHDMEPSWPDPRCRWVKVRSYAAPHVDGFGDHQ